MALPRVPPLDDGGTGSLADLVDWYVVLGEEPTVIGTKTGRLQTTLRYICPDTETMHPGMRSSYLSRLHSVLGTLQAGWAADWDWWHEQAAAYPASQWEEPTHWLVDELRRWEYEAEPRHESVAYLTLSWCPGQRRHRWLDGLFLTGVRVRERSRQAEQEVRNMQLGVKRFVSLLRDVMTVEDLTVEDVCTYLHRCVSWDRVRVRRPMAMALDQQLTNTRFVPGQPPKLGHQWIQPLWIASWGEELGTWLPMALEKMPFPCRLLTRWEAMGTQAAAKFLHWEEKRWAGNYSSMLKKVKQSEGVDGQSEVQGRDENPEAIHAGQSLIRTREEVMAGQEALGVLTATLLTWAPEEDVLVKQRAALETLCFSQGLVVDAERAGASLGWIASLPGNVAVGMRGVTLRTRELSALMPHTQVWTGPERDDCLQGPPVMVGTTDGVPFRLVTHVGELGHMLVAGPSRSGKSGFIGLLARQWFRYPHARVCAFDRDFALKAVTILSGGTHYALGTPGSPGFQPLGDLETEAQQRWALTWLEAILTGEGLAPISEEREEIWLMVQRLAGLEPRQRTMSMARQQLQVQRLKIGLTPFCEGGAYPFFDANEDMLGLEATRMVCFEMNALLSYPRAIEAALGYIFHLLETLWFDGAPVHIIVDEAKWLLEMKSFVGEVELWLKARAKKNVSITLSTQELADIHSTSAWQAVLASVPTRIFLPNAAATDPDVAQFYRSVGLTDEELSILASAQTVRDYLYKSPLGTRLFQMRLAPVERLLCAASRMEELEVLAKMQQEETPETLAVAWLRHWGYRDEAQILEEARHAVEQDRDDERDVEWMGSRGVYPGAPDGHDNGRHASG